MRARPIGLHKNSSGTVSNFYALHFFSSGPVKNSDVALTKARDECQLAIQCKLQPIRSLDVGGESVGDLLAGRVDECVASAAAVVRDVRSRSVESGDHFVRIGADGEFASYSQAARIDNKKRVVFFGQDQQSTAGRSLCIKGGRCQYRDEKKEDFDFS